MSYTINDLNYIDIDNGCMVIDYSSQIKGSLARNLINSNLNSLWMSKIGLPQSITLDLEKLKIKNTVNCFGVFCQYSNKSNPKTIKIYINYKTENSYKFKKLSNLNKDNLDDEEEINYTFYGSYELELVKF